MDTQQEELFKLRRERDYWRGVAAYLANCHAGTAEYDGQLSSVSKVRRERFASICKKAALMLKGPQDIHVHESLCSCASAMQRCLHVSKRLLGEE